MNNGHQNHPADLAGQHLYCVQSAEPRTIAIALAAVGAWKNILFLLVIFINTVMGIVQEIKAKRQIQRLTLLAQPVVTVLRDGAEECIRPEDFQTGDVLVFTGSAVCTATPGFLCLSITILIRNSFFPKLYRAFCHTTFLMSAGGVIEQMFDALLVHIVVQLIGHIAAHIVRPPHSQKTAVGRAACRPAGSGLTVEGHGVAVGRCHSGGGRRKAPT